MKKTFVLLATLASAVLGGCAGPGELARISITMPGGEKATILAHNQQFPDWMLAKDKLALNYVVKGDVNDKQLAAVAEAERACRFYTKTVRPHELVAVIANGVIYGAIAYPFGRLGAAALTGTNVGQTAKYISIVSAGGGVANGLIQAGGQTYTFENCGREVMTMFPGYEVRVLNKSPY